MSGLSAPVSTQNLITFWKSGHVVHQRANCVCTSGGVCDSIESLCRQIALRTPVSRSTLFRRIDGGTVTVDEADRYACALGVTPYRIWPGIDRAPVVAALSPSAPSVGTLF